MAIKINGVLVIVKIIHGEGKISIKKGKKGKYSN